MFGIGFGTFGGLSCRSRVTRANSARSASVILDLSFSKLYLSADSESGCLKYIDKYFSLVFVY